MASLLIFLLIVLQVFYSNGIKTTDNNYSTEYDSKKKNLIIGAITNYNWDQISIFFNSLIMSNIENCDVVFFVGNMPQTAIDKMISYGIIVYSIPEKYMKERIINTRWKIAMDYLDSNPNKYKYVFTGDTRDIFFQDDPFKHYNLQESYLGIAIEDGDLDEITNKGWIINAYGEEKHNAIKHERIFCVGTVWGTVDKFYEFSKLMWVNLDSDWSKQRQVIEQSVGNYIIYYDKKFSDCLIKSDNDNGYIMTIGLTRPEKMIFDLNNIVYNREFKKAAVVHQYDRHNYLVNKAIAKYYFNQKETSFSINPQKKNLILGIIKDYKWNEISPFFNSIKNTKFENCDIVIYIVNISKDIEEKIKSFGVIVYQMDEKYIKESLITSKYKIAMDYLDSNINKYNYIFTGDIRSIYFQDDPFKYYSVGKSYLGIAIKDDILFGNVYKKSYINKYGKEKFQTTKNEKLFLVDIIWGTVDKFYKFSKIMLYNIGSELSNDIEKIVGNYIIYYEKIFNDCLIKSNKDDGYIVSIDLNEHKKTNKKLNNIINNAQGRKAAVVYKYCMPKKLIQNAPTFTPTFIIIIILVIFIFIIFYYYNKCLYRKNYIDFIHEILKTKNKNAKGENKKKKKEKIIFDEDLEENAKIIKESQ